MYTALISLTVRFDGTRYAFFEITGSHYYSALRDSVFGRMDDFVLGMLICDLYASGVISRRFTWSRALFAAGLVILFAGTNIWDSINTGKAELAFAPLTNNFMQAGFFFVITAVLSLENGALKFIFTNRLIQVLGMMRYSLYIWHHLVLRLIMRRDYLFAVSVAQPYSAYNLTLYFVCFAVLSALTYRHIEFGAREGLEGAFSY